MGVEWIAIGQRWPVQRPTFAEGVWSRQQHLLPKTGVLGLRHGDRARSLFGLFAVIDDAGTEGPCSPFSTGYRANLCPRWDGETTHGPRDESPGGRRQNGNHRESEAVATGETKRDKLARARDTSTGGYRVRLAA